MLKKCLIAMLVACLLCTNKCFKVDILAATTINEIENNGGFKLSQDIPLNHRISGSFKSSSDLDYYKIEIKNNTSIELEKDFKDRHVYVRLYDYRKKRILNDYYSSDEKIYFNLEKGTYYLVLKGEKTTYTFTLKGILQNVKGKNHSFKTAEEVGLNKTIIGWPTLGNTKEVYEVKSEMGTYLRLNIVEGLNNIKRIKIYDKNKKLKSTISKFDSVNNKNIYISSGKNFIVVESELFYSKVTKPTFRYEIKLNHHVFWLNQANVKLSINSTSSLRLDWKKQTNVDGYYVYIRKHMYEKNYKKIATKSAKETSYIIKNLEVGCYYDVKLVGYKKKGDLMYKSEVFEKAIFTGAPSFKNLKCTLVNNTIHITADKSNSFLMYQIYLDYRELVDLGMSFPPGLINDGYGLEKIFYVESRPLSKPKVISKGYFPYSVSVVNDTGKSSINITHDILEKDVSAIRYVVVTPRVEEDGKMIYGESTVFEFH